MENINYKIWIKNAYYIVSGICVTYQIYRIVSKKIQQSRNSLAKAEILANVRNQARQIMKEDQTTKECQSNSETQSKERFKSRRESRSQSEEKNPVQRRMKSRTESTESLFKQESCIPQEIVEQSKHKIIKVCLTGGPCAGKTSGLAFLSEKLQEDEFKVYVVPEAATLISNGGGMINLSDFNSQDTLKFQKALMKIQIALEDNFERIARISDEESIILCDRGLIDGRAFLTDRQWYTLLKDMKLTERGIRDKRYDIVIHMVTAADGAEQFYVKEGARYQNLEEAVQVDKLFQQCWLGHQRLEIIDNRSVSSFEEKLDKLLQTVRRMSGVPVKGQKLYLRYIILSPQTHPNLPETVQCEYFDIEDTFLYKPQHDENLGKLTKIRKRTQNDDSIYLCSESHIIDGKQTMYYKKRLNFREYLLLKDREDRDRITLRKLRRQFVHNGYFYILDKYLDYNMCILRVKNSSDLDENKVIIPEFLQIDADVTEYKEFRSINISLKNSPLRDNKTLEELVYAIQDQQKSFIKFEDKIRPRPNMK